MTPRAVRLAVCLGLASSRLWASSDAPPVAAPVTESFRIAPRRPIAALRREALAAAPPRESRVFGPVDLVELRSLDPTVRLDLRYASQDNFLGVVVYEHPRALLQRPAALALIRAHRRLATKGYGLLVHDAYRPWWVTKLFWEATPLPLRRFVADPARGSRHNRGCAVDLTLFCTSDGAPAEMPSLYDEMTVRASATYAGGTVEARARRDLLRRAMESEGFRVNRGEWWHFDHPCWRDSPILNVAFDAVRTR